jgi:hypothetical protein
MQGRGEFYREYLNFLKNINKNGPHFQVEKAGRFFFIRLEPDYFRDASIPIVAMSFSCVTLPTGGVLVK